MRAISTSSTPLAPFEAARQFIDKIRKPSCILIAISGGSDSTGLLLALHMVLKATGRQDIALHAVTVDHALRRESAEEARGVAALCRKLDIPHHIRRWAGEKPKTGLSAAARLARYGLIASVATEVGADMAVVGHTLGDQQETVSMRTSRSSRSDNLGLAGMADAVLYDSRLWVLRPFLAVTRQDIRDFLVEQGYGWFDDPSNDDAKYERVRVRKASAIELAEDHQPMRTELSRNAASLIRTHVSVFSNVVVKLDCAALESEAVVLRYALSALAAVVGGRPFGPSAEAMDRVLALLASGEAARHVAGRVVFDRRRDGLYLVRENRNIETIQIKPKQTSMWDDRFRITNNCAEIINVLAGSRHGETIASLQSPGLPAGIIQRATHAHPVVQREASYTDVFHTQDIVARAALAPYDLFLTRFDLNLANAMADCFGLPGYIQPPV